MRPLARYSLTGKTGEGTNPGSLDALRGIVSAWLEAKGWDRSATSFQLGDGREATVRQAEASSELGDISEWLVSEPTVDGLTKFHTKLTLAQCSEDLTIYCELSASAVDDVLAPRFVEARCPAVIRTLISAGSQWFYGQSHLSSQKISAHGRDQGELLVRVLTAPERRLPILVVSSNRGLTIQPHLARTLAGDLAGLANVVQVDDQAAWRALSLMGVEWACRSGAIRLYWPTPIPGSDPRRHPFWTPGRLLHEAKTVDDAVQRLRNFLRRRLMDISVSAVSEPAPIAAIRASVARAEEAKEIASARDNNEWESLARLFQQERDRWRAAAETSERDNDELRTRLYRLQMQTTFAEVEDPDDIPPDAVPSNLSQAVAIARVELSDCLVFGRQVDAGVGGLRPDAGPPEKVLDYFRVLALMVDELRKGPLGNSLVGWLSDMGVSCSGESETIRNNAARMRARQWDDGSRPRQFEMHLKPNEALGPDRCVRIYFDWDPALKQVVIGWVGRHPE